MMNDIDTTVARLCLMILAGELDIIPILADRLEELGHPYTDLVRQDKGADSLKLILLALPVVQCQLLACDFAEHVLPRFERAFVKDERPKKAIATARRFAQGKTTANVLQIAQHAAWKAWTTKLDYRDNQQKALAAGRAAARCAWHPFDAWAARIVAWAAREAGNKNERKWQLNHLKAYLAKSL